MERIGERLKRRREELGFTIEAVAASMKFRPEIIRAVEEGRVDVFPAEAYLKAFLKAYAATLGLDTGEILNYQKTEEERVQEAIRGMKIRPRKRSGRSTKPVLIGVIVAAAVVAVVLALTSFERPGVETGDVSSAAESLETSAEPPGLVDSTAARPQGAERQDVEAAVPAVPTETSPGTASVEDTGRTRVPLESPGNAQAARGDEAVSLPPADRTDRSGPLPAESAETEEGIQPAEQSPPVEQEGMDRVDLTPDTGPETDRVAGRSCLEIAARQGFFIRISSGGETILDDYLKGGDRRTLYSVHPFVVVSLSDRHAVSLTLDGEPVALPDSPDRGIYNFTIPQRREAQ
jgi:cytoskeleton protein RodZ